MEQIYQLISENIPTIISSLVGLVLSIISFLVAFFKTKKSSLEKKINSCIVKKDLNLDLTKYYVLINHVKYRVSDLQFLKEDDNGNS